MRDVAVDVEEDKCLEQQEWEDQRIEMREMKWPAPDLLESLW